MFDTWYGADQNLVPREGAGVFSHDGFPADDAPDGLGGSHYDAATGQQLRNVPRGFLHTAAHEVGHVLNQHHPAQGDIDNSIMSTSDQLANLLGFSGIFPDDVALEFNDRAASRLNHFPDPMVRPGAMEIGGTLVAPEVSAVTWLETAELSLTLSSERPVLGEPVIVDFTLANTGETPLPIPKQLNRESFRVRLSVTDPSGEVTFMRPLAGDPCPQEGLNQLPPGNSASGETVLFWGRDGFAFKQPGRHIVDLILLWEGWQFESWERGFGACGGECGDAHISADMCSVLLATLAFQPDQLRSPPDRGMW